MRPLLTLLLVAFAGCDTTTAAAGGDYTCTNTPVLSYPQAGVAGAACKKSADCQYGTCEFSALQLAGHITTTEGVCTKNCACGAATSQCSADDNDANNLHFTCIKQIGGTASECAVKCASVADCQKINPRFNACTESSDAYGTADNVCTIQ